MKRNINRTHKSHRHGRIERPPFSHVVSVGSDGFKIGSPSDEQLDEPRSELPTDRPPIADIVAAHRSGCMPAILRFFMRRKYGTDFTESKYVPPEKCSHGVPLSATCSRCREENPEFLS